MTEPTRYSARKVDVDALGQFVTKADFDRLRDERDLWWRERLTSDETLEAVAKEMGGFAWVGIGERGRAQLRRDARMALTSAASLLPVPDPEVPDTLTEEKPDA